MRFLLLLLVLLGGPAWAREDSAAQVACPCNGNAADWATDTRFHGSWEFDERFPFSFGTAGASIRDRGPHANQLSDGSSTHVSTDARERCRAADQTSTVIQISCGTSCVNADFQFPGSWTMGCWEKPRECGGVCTRYTLSTNNGNNVGGVGYRQGWKQGGNGAGTFIFGVDPTTPATEVVATSVLPYTPGTWHHHVSQFNAGTMRQYIDGAVDANTASAAALSTWGTFSIGVSPFNRSGQGLIDDCFVFDGVLSAADICRIAVCGVRGCGCECNGAAYVSRPLHSSAGGPVSCTMPAACNKAAPD